MKRLTLWGVLAMTIAMIGVAAGSVGSLSPAAPPGISKDDITADVAVITLGNWNKTGEGSATVDLSGNTVLTIASGSFHTNGDLKVQNPSQLVSDGIVTAKRNLVCTNPNDPACLPPQATNAQNVPDPLSHLPGSFPNLGGKQNWPSCNDSCVVTPGRYRGPYNVNTGVEILLQPGYYRFSNQILNLNGTFRIDPDASPHPETGMGVTLMFEKNASLEIGATGGLQFDAPEAGPYEGIAIYYHRSNKNTLGWRASNNQMTGWIYAKQGHLRLNNDADWTAANRFVFRSMNSQGGNFTIDPGGTVVPFEPIPDVVPIFECYVEEFDGSFTAYFGYENLTVDENGDLMAIQIPLGADNVVTPSSADGLQPIDFVVPGVVDGQPGRTGLEDAEPNAFIIADWDGSDVTWSLGDRTATADLSRNCASQEPLNPFCLGARATIVGTENDDVLAGTDGDDVIYADAGNDVVDGGLGNDLICGGDGEDVLNGDDGNDRLDGGDGHDVVDGGVGDDELSGGVGDDVLLGQDGADTLEGGEGDDALRGGAGDDELNDADLTVEDRDSVDDDEGTNVCDVDLDDVEVAC